MKHRQLVKIEVSRAREYKKTLLRVEILRFHGSKLIFVDKIFTLWYFDLKHIGKLWKICKIWEIMGILRLKKYEKYG